MHGLEAFLFYLLILGPLLALAVTVFVVGRREAQDDETGPGGL
jgi:hypothetical protein